MADLIHKRLTGKEEGFTLIELLVVIVILGILMAIAVPSYMGFRDRANKTAAQADVRAAIPAIESYYADHAKYADDATVGNLGTFDAAWIKAKVDQGLGNSVVITSVASGVQYCVSAEVGGYIAALTGPGDTANIPVANDGTVKTCS